MADAPVPGGMSLLNTVSKNASAMATPGSAQGAALGGGPTGGENTAQVQALTATAATGKEATQGIGGNPKLSSLSEKLAGMNNLLNMQQLQQQGTMQSTAQAQQAQAQMQQFTQASGTMDIQRANAMQDWSNQASAIMTNQADEIKKMGLADDKSRAEQLGLMLRLSNEKYVTQLNDTAAKARADTTQGFQIALKNSVFAQETDLLNTNLQFRNFMNQDHREAVKGLASMDLGFAMAIAAADNKAAAAGMMWSGAGQVASAGAQAYASYKPEDNTGADTSEAAGPNAGSLDMGQGPSNTEILS